MRKPKLQPLDLTAVQWRRLHLPGRQAKIPGDPEIRRFVKKALKTMTFNEIAQACRERFGAERAPSKTAIGRYQLALEKSRRRG